MHVLVIIILAYNDNHNYVNLSLIAARKLRTWHGFSESNVVHQTVVSYALSSERSNYKTDYQSSVARPNSCTSQAWGQSTWYFDTLVLEYRFCCTRRHSVLVLLNSTCTRTCTQVLLKINVLLTSTYEYITSTSHLKLIQKSSETNQKTL